MGDPDSSNTWRKLVIAKTNDQWVSISNIKTEQTDDVDSTHNAMNLSLDYEPPYQTVKAECLVVSDNQSREVNDLPSTFEIDVDPLLISRHEKSESSVERASRLAKMSAYAAQRLANETPQQRATRLKRMSEYAAKRLASETIEQRAKRLARMSAYAARRLAQETPEQRQARLTRMSAYAARRKALKKNGAAANNTQPKTRRNAASQLNCHNEVTAHMQQNLNQS